MVGGRPTNYHLQLQLAKIVVGGRCDPKSIQNLRPPSQNPRKFTRFFNVLQYMFTLDIAICTVEKSIPTAVGVLQSRVKHTHRGRYRFFQRHKDMDR